MRKQTVAIALTATLLFLGLSGCSSHENTAAASLQRTRCLEELNAIPEVNALREYRKKAGDETDPKPFTGLELALTINGMMTSKIDPAANLDDLCYAQDTRENFDKLVKALLDGNMPPTVNFIEGQWFDPVLQAEWLKSGNLLGNLTYDRRTAKKSHEQELVDNVARNDQLLASVWKTVPPKRKYFRHPHPKTINNPRDRAAISAYLKQNGYVEAPITIESPDRLFSQMYCSALAKGNTDCANLIKANFFSMLLDATLKGRAYAREVAGREIKHVLVIHASQLVCDMLAETLLWFRGLGARFISLDEALRDPFYAGANLKPGALQTTPHAPPGKD